VRLRFTFQIEKMHRLLRKYHEVIIWNGVLIVLASMDVESGISFCLLKTLGLSWCPGCGIGHAMHYALHFEFAKSFDAHILGIPGVLIIFYQSCKSIYTLNKINKYGPTTTTKNVSGYGV